MSIDINMIGLVTRDMAESIRFYRALGLEVADPGNGQDHHEARLPSGVRLAWETVELIKQIDPHWVEPVGQQITLAFLCEGPAGVDSTYTKIVEAGFKSLKQPWDAFWGQRYALVQDPDGNSIDLFAPL